MEILHRAPGLIVCVKPSGADSEHDLPRMLTEQEGLKQCFCVHRLDREVGGVMVYALDGRNAARLTEQFSGHGVTKEYLCVCEGRPDEDEGLLTDLLYHDTRTNKTFVVERMRRGVKEARLRYTLLQTVEQDGQLLSLLRIRLETGRSHQIRVQLASRGLPLMGDRRYGSKMKHSGIALYCAHLGFTAPNGQPMDFTSRPPRETPWTLFAIEDTLFTES